MSDATGAGDPGTGGDDSLSTVMKTASTKRVVTGGLILTTADIAGSLFFTLYNMALARLSPAEGAILTVVSTFLYMLRVFALLGFTGAGAKFISEYLERDVQEARKYGISAAKYNFLVIGTPLIVAAVALFYVQGVLTGEPVRMQAFSFLIVLTAVDRLKSCSDTYLLAYQRYDLYAISWGVPYGAMYLAAFLLVPVLGPIGPLLSWTVGELAMFCLSLFFVRRVSDFPLRDLFSWRKEFGLFKKMFSFNFLFALANLCFSLLTTTLFISMGQLLGILTDQEIVSLGVVSTFSNILINVFGIVAGIQPAISQAYALKNKRLVENYFLASVKFPLMMSIAVITFFLVFGEEMLEIFFSERYIVIGLLIMSFLIPSYAFSAFASRYDNILAGIGRPETAIIPWFAGMTVAITGFVIIRLAVPTGVYLVNSWHLVKTVGGTMELVNYGITLSFAIGLVVMATGLVIPGVSIVYIAIKVLNVKIPRHYLSRPAFAAGITAAAILAFKLLVPFKQLLDARIPAGAGGIVYTVIMILGGILLYISAGVLLGGFSREDGRFWRSVVSTIPVAAVLLKPLFAWGRFLLRKVPERLRNEEVTWITSTKRDEMEKDMEFVIEDDFTERYGAFLLRNAPVEITVQVRRSKAKFHHALVHAKLDMVTIPGSHVYKEVIDGETAITMRFQLPEDTRLGHHELYIDVEMYANPQPGMDVTKLTRRWKGWTYFDFAFKWFDEKIKYVVVE